MRVSGRERIRIVRRRLARSRLFSLCVVLAVFSGTSRIAFDEDAIDLASRFFVFIGFGALSEDKWESQLWSIFMIATGATAARRLLVLCVAALLAGGRRARLRLREFQGLRAVLVGDLRAAV